MFVDSLMKNHENEQNLNHIYNKDHYNENGLWFPPKNEF